jgi:hypothetical protein
LKKKDKIWWVFFIALTLTLTLLRHCPSSPVSEKNGVETEVEQSEEDFKL